MSERGALSTATQLSLRLNIREGWRLLCLFCRARCRRSADSNDKTAHCSRSRTSLASCTTWQARLTKWRQATALTFNAGECYSSRQEGLHMRRATWTLCHPFCSVALNNVSSSSRATTTVPQYRAQRMENPIKTYLQHGHLFKLGSL
jgi:hypothetical protein